MQTVKFHIATKSSPEIGEKLIALGLVPGSHGPETQAQSPFSAAHLKLVSASSKAESISRSLGPDGRVYLLLGLGVETPTVDGWRALGGALGRSIPQGGAVELNIEVPDTLTAEALLEGVALGAARVSTESSTKKSAKANKTEVTLVTPLSISGATLKRIGTMALAVHKARDLATRPANKLYPENFAQLAKDSAEELELACKIWSPQDLESEGFGLISAVGMGSARLPRLVKLEYNPKGAESKLALVGKGITFDTGGLAVKPLGGMLGMKYDMTGAAVVFAAVEAIAKLRLPIKVSAYLCLAENMLSGTAMRPGDVFTARNGKTVEVANPDAEGRLVLADGLSLASEDIPSLIVDVATLTGAARVALGTRYSAVMGSSSAVNQVLDAAQAAGELAWEMPLASELRANLDSDVADIRNAKVGSTAGGMIVGAHFLSEFIGNDKKGKKLEWAHIDIAGPADNDGSAYGYTPAGPTGVMVRTLVTLAERMSA